MLEKLTDNEKACFLAGFMTAIENDEGFGHVIYDYKKTWLNLLKHEIKDEIFFESLQAIQSLADEEKDN